MFLHRMYNQNSTSLDMKICSIDKSTGMLWEQVIAVASPTMSNYYVVNDLLSFGGLGDKLLAVTTSEDLNTQHFIYLIYMKGAGGTS